MTRGVEVKMVTIIENHEQYIIWMIMQGLRSYLSEEDFAGWSNDYSLSRSNKHITIELIYG